MGPYIEVYTFYLRGVGVDVCLSLRPGAVGQGADARGHIGDCQHHLAEHIDDCWRRDGHLDEDGVDIGNLACADSAQLGNLSNGSADEA